MWTESISYKKKPVKQKSEQEKKVTSQALVSQTPVVDIGECGSCTWTESK